MEASLLGVGLFTFLASCVGASFLFGALAGYFYYPHYNNGAEKTGALLSLWFRTRVSSVVGWVTKRYFNYTVVYHSATGEPQEKQAALIREYSEGGGDGREGKVALFASHPHGIFPVGTIALLGSWSHLRPCVHRHIFATPILREFMLWLGAIDVTRENIDAQLDEGNSVILLPGGCREMIHLAAASEEKAEAKQQKKLWLLNLSLFHPDLILQHLVAFVLFPLTVGTLARYFLHSFEIASLLAFTVFFVAPIAYLLLYLVANMKFVTGAYEIQDKHCGFLSIAWRRKVPVIAVLHRGQDRVYRTIAFKPIDAIRTWFLERTGYPFPTFFLGPLPEKLTTHVLPPFSPNNYASEKAFIDDYYTTVKEKYALFCSQSNGDGTEPRFV
jgi:hypothetical protein